MQHKQHHFADRGRWSQEFQREADGKTVKCGCPVVNGNCSFREQLKLEGSSGDHHGNWSVVIFPDKAGSGRVRCPRLCPGFDDACRRLFLGVL